MTRRKRKINSDVVLDELVAVAYAEDRELAEQYKEVLNENDIPAAVKANPDDGTPYKGIAVMVSEDDLDEAHVLIESRNSVADFFDMAFGDDLGRDSSMFDEDDDELF